MKELNLNSYILKDSVKGENIDQYLGVEDIEIQEEIENILDSDSDHELAGILPMKAKVWQDLLVKSFEAGVTREQLIANLDKIKKAIRQIRTSEHFYAENFSEEEIEAARIYIKKVIERARNGDLEKIGEGNSAFVFVDKNFPSFCFKILRGESLNDISINDVLEESKYLDELSNFQVGDSKTPKPYYVLMDNEQGVHYLVMETMKAVSLDEFKKQKMILPDNFNLDKAIADFKIYIKKLNNDYSIDHNDIRDPNIMIDLENSAFVLIDFGKSKRRRVEAKNIEETSDLKNLNIIMDNFLTYLKK